MLVVLRSSHYYAQAQFAGYAQNLHGRQSLWPGWHVLHCVVSADADSGRLATASASSHGRGTRARWIVEPVAGATGIPPEKTKTHLFQKMFGSDVNVVAYIQQLVLP